ncbi:hypothetical protein FNV43_RR17016 [Rhamnella rubrinervis]|uniref:Uncharacterized protein n=1 Tax=Rhamnella rubrinervis TaxID=2594499 RepID=A0A8K0GZW8_9ROSA|nr:hypothetical protein FNV43_RR17016 [Rhamnella rubrinervis]
MFASYRYYRDRSLKYNLRAHSADPDYNTMFDRWVPRSGFSRIWNKEIYESLTAKLEDWFELTSNKSAPKNPAFDVPFELIDLQKFDYALEGISFQQLFRMPNAVYASTSDAAEATAHFAIEDFYMPV